MRKALRMETVGSLASGNRYRVTSYLIEVVGPDGNVLAIIDAADVTEVRRTAQTVTVLQKDGNSTEFTGTTLDDAGRLEAAVRANLTSFSATSSQPTKSWLKWGCLGTLGTVGLCVLIGLVAFAFDSNDDDGDSDENPASIATTSERDASGKIATETPLPGVGEAVAIPEHNWILTVEDVRKTRSTDTAIIGSEDALGIYLIVDIQMENTGRTSHSLSGNDFMIVDSQGREYKWYSDGSIGYGLQNLGDKINAGLKAPGTMLFDIPEDATGLVLTALDGDYMARLGDISDIDIDS